MMLASLSLLAWSTLPPVQAEPLIYPFSSFLTDQGPDLQSGQQNPAVAPSARRFSVSLYYEDVEFGELDAESSSASVTFVDVPRERIGVQFGFEQGYARIYKETIDADSLGTEFDGFGLGVGVRGFYNTTPKRDVAFLVDYDASVDLSFLDEDEFDGEVFSLSMEGKVGPGIGYQSFRASAGVAASFIFGTLEVPGFEDVDLDGQNVGFYLGLGYVPDEIPVTARFDLHFGDIEGAVLSIGYAF